MFIIIIIIIYVYMLYLNIITLWCISNWYIALCLLNFSDNLLV